MLNYRSKSDVAEKDVVKNISPGRGFPEVGQSAIVKYRFYLEVIPWKKFYML